MCVILYDFTFIAEAFSEKRSTMHTITSTAEVSYQPCKCFYRQFPRIFFSGNLIACVASVPLRAEWSIGTREGVFAFGTGGKWGESKKYEGGGWGRGKKGTLPRKPLYSEKPVRPRTWLLIGAAWFIWLIGWTRRYHIKRSNWRNVWQILNRMFERSFIGAQRNRDGFFVEKGTRECNVSYF